MKHPLMIPGQILIDLADIRMIHYDKASSEFVVCLKDNKELRLHEDLGHGLLNKINLKENFDFLKNEAHRKIV